ncbi:MAG: hypothetical protein RBU37_05515 [Myxococcota bacterium]|jgi:hypothetical protein|nr:hypothetical protein [Myxococcota bacterium]
MKRGGSIEPRLLRADFDAAAPGSAGVIAFKWGSFAKDEEKVEALRQFYGALSAGDDAPP